MLNKIFKKSFFTLTELIVVITVLGILSLIIIPNISSFREQAEDTKRLADIRNIQTAVDAYYSKNGVYPTQFEPILTNEEIIWDKLYPDYVRKIPKVPKDLKEYESYYVDNYGVVVLNYNTYAPFLKWLKESDFIVSDPTNPVYGGINPPKGGVIRNYDLDTLTFKSYDNKVKVFTFDSAITGDALLEAYKVTKDPVFLNRAILIGDYFKTNIISDTIYGRSVYKIVPLKEYNGGWTTYSDLESKDLLVSAKFLIKLSMLSGDSSYANEGKKLMDTVFTIQTIIAESGSPNEQVAGALPYYITTGGFSWGTYPLDLGYMMYDAGDLAYQYFKDSKYKKISNDFFAFSDKAFSTFNGLSPKGYPYEFIVHDGTNFVGQNFDQITGLKGPNEPFTTDQFFYTAIGLMKNGSPRASNMYDLATELTTNNFEFFGQYNVDGTANSQVEIINTAFYLEMVKHYENAKAKKIAYTLFKYMLEDETNKNINSAWAWAPNEPYIESVASAINAQKILEQIK